LKQLIDKTLTRLKTFRPEHVFIWIAICVEVLLTLLSPPLQSPDEINHFYRAYQVSEGDFFPLKKDQRLGGNLPYCFKEFAAIFEPVSGNEYYRIRDTELRSMFDIRLDAGKREFQDFPNTANYSAVSYVPQALGLALLRQFDVSVGTLYYGGRLAIFLTWFLTMFIVIRMVPVYKWLFTLLALLPMNIYISSSFSADTMTNILSFLMIAIVIKLSYSPEKVNVRQVFLILVIGVLLACAKILYVALVLLFLVISAKQFISVKFRVVSASLICLVCFLAAYLASAAVMKYYISYFNYNPLYRDIATLEIDTDYYIQKAYSLKHKGYLLSILYETVTDFPMFYILSYVGGFGTFLHLFMPGWICALTYAVILYLAMNEQKRMFTFKQKLVFAGTALIMTALLVLSQHLTWNAIGQHGLLYLQGRYFIPIFPLLFLLFNGFSIKLKISNGIVVVSLLLLLYGYLVPFLRFSYLTDHHYAETRFYCDAEQSDGNGYLTTDVASIKLGGGSSRSADEHRSGNYSVKLTPDNAFAFSFNFGRFDKHDLVEITAWQKGEGGALVISGKGEKCGDFYYPNRDILFEDKDGWKKMRMVFSMWEICGNSSAGFYVFNSGHSTVYFDDVSFNLRKFKEGAVYYH